MPGMVSSEWRKMLPAAANFENEILPVTQDIEDLRGGMSMCS
jgi:hypothetical protein